MVGVVVSPDMRRTGSRLGEPAPSEVADGDDVSIFIGRRSVKVEPERRVKGS